MDIENANRLQVNKLRPFPSLETLSIAAFLRQDVDRYVCFQELSLRLFSDAIIRYKVEVNFSAQNVEEPPRPRTLLLPRKRETKACLTTISTG